MSKRASKKGGNSGKGGKGGGKPEVERQADYYMLRTKAVDDLVNANVHNSPPVSEAELRAYTSRPKLKVAGWVKLLFIKAWFAGAVCFFFLWGLGNYLPDQLDMLFVTGTALGIVTDLLTNNVLRFVAKTRGGNDRWIMFPQKGWISFPLNILYGYVILLMVVVIYNVINIVIVRATGAADTVPLGVEPILFGIFCMGCDMLLIWIKHLLAGLFRGRKAEKEAEKEAGK